MRPLRPLAWSCWPAGIGLSVASGLIPASVWVNDISPSSPSTLWSFLLIFPGLMAVLLYRMRLRPGRPAMRPGPRGIGPSTHSGASVPCRPPTSTPRWTIRKRADEYADLGIRLNEPLLHLPRYRVLYAMSINVKGKLALDEGRYAEAFDAFHRPLRMNLEHRLYIPLFLSNCAAALYGLGKFEEALEYTQRALAQNPPQQTAVTLLAHHNAALV